MHRVRLLAILAASLAVHGCSLINSGTSGVAGEVQLALTHHQLLKQARQQARSALQEFRAANRGPAPSKDFESGFEDGYVRTVWWGAEEAPIIPPSEYWSARYQNPEGRQAIGRWTEGYQHGVNVALQTGAALSMKLPGSGRPPDDALVPAPIHAEPQAPPSSELEKLPAPRPLPPAARLPSTPLPGSTGTARSIVPVAHQVRATVSSKKPEEVQRTQAPVPAREIKDLPAALPVPESNFARDHVPAMEVDDKPPVQLGRPW